MDPSVVAVEDCAMVLDAIYGPDGQDLATRDAAFNWDVELDWKKLRIGYLKSEFDPAGMPEFAKAKDAETAEEKKQRELHNAELVAGHARRTYDQRFDLAALEKLKSMGLKLIPVELPKLPYGAMARLLTAEAAAAFDDLTMTVATVCLQSKGVGIGQMLFE